MTLLARTLATIQTLEEHPPGAKAFAVTLSQLEDAKTNASDFCQDIFRAVDRSVALKVIEHPHTGNLIIMLDNDTPGETLQ